MLVPNFPVSSTAVFVLTSNPSTRKLQITNNGPGPLLFQIVSTGSPTTLTTGNGTAVTGPQPNIIDYTPGVDTQNGFDLYAISNTNTVASFQTFPL